jgi:hypothetical protein
MRDSRGRRADNQFLAASTSLDKTWWVSFNNGEMEEESKRSRKANQEVVNIGATERAVTMTRVIFLERKQHPESQSLSGSGSIRRHLSD